MKRIFLSVLAALSLISCGGGAIIAAGISGTGISGTQVVIGAITGFGSIFVNGVEYETTQVESFDVDGNTRERVDDNYGLAIGMVVRLNTATLDDGTTVVTTIFYDDSIQGPVTAIDVLSEERKQLTVLGQTVVIDVAKTTFDDVTFETIEVDDVIEVSGFAAQNGAIDATRIEKKDNLKVNPNARVELRGAISNSNNLDQFSLLGITIKTTAQTELDGLTRFDDGLVVEVKGLFQTDGSILAEEVELESGESSTSLTSVSGTVSLQGLVTRFDNGVLTVNGIPVNTDSIASQVAALNLAVGMQVEVEGEMIDGILHATEIELRSGNAHIEGNLVSVDTSAGTLAVGFTNTGTRVLTVNSKTNLYDELNQRSLTLAELAGVAGSAEVAVDILVTGNNWIATTVKRKTLKKHKISGVVSATPSADSLVVNGITLTMDPGSETEYKNASDQAVSAADFFAALTLGQTIVEIEDKNKDGLFNEAEIE